MVFTDEIVMQLVSMEQVAIFVLHDAGVQFYEMRLYRRLSALGSEQGILVNGKVAYSLTYQIHTVPVIGRDEEAILVDINGKFHPPFDSL